ncbi:MAG: hypothetical protein R3Y59_01975 [bacterium]
MMSEVSKHIEGILIYLNNNSNYALLRNYDGLPSNNSSRDIDIIISRKEYKRCKDKLLNALTNDDWKIFSFLDNGRLITYVMAKVVGAKIDLVQWDFFTDTSVHGVKLLSAEEMLLSRKFNGVLYHVSKEYEFLDKYVYNRAVRAQYPAKYSALMDEAKGSDIVQGKLKRLFGCSDIERLNAKRGLLFRAFLRNLCYSPICTVVSVIVSIYLYVISCFGKKIAPTLAFTGADGAGKSTVIDMIIQSFSSVYGKATESFHFRPTLFGNLGEVAHSVGMKKEVDREYSNPHRGKNSGFISSFLRLCYYSTDYILGYFIKVKSHCRITKLIIFDRYYSDLIVDSRRSLIFLNMGFLYVWGKLFIPKMRYNFLVTADSDIILSRKKELDKADIVSINKNMTYLSNKKGYYLIENNNTPEECIQKIISIVVNEQHTQNLKRVAKN